MKPVVSEIEEADEVIPEDMLWIYDVNGIAVEDGIKNSGGASAFVNSLNLFYDTIDENAQKIEEAFAYFEFKLD